MLSPARRCLAALGLVFVTLATVAPGLAQEVAEQWEGSGFDPPFDDRAHTVRESNVTVEGRFFYQKSSQEQAIDGVVIDYTDFDDDYALDQACTLPERTRIQGNEPDIADTDELTFSVTDLVFECNGRYRIAATASFGDDMQTIDAVVVVEVAPSPVRDLTARQIQDGVIEVLWKAGKRSPDFIGYRVQRAGPANADGDFGDFANIRPTTQETGIHDRPPTNGRYRYRVRSVRRGPTGDVTSRAGDSPTAAAEASGITATTTTTPFQQGTGTAVTAPRSPRTTFRAPPPPTTIDTGFESELDYGDQPNRTITETIELPSEFDDALGGSIVQNEGDGFDWIGFSKLAAGALVLIGWAGHVGYLNRLSRLMTARAEAAAAAGSTVVATDRTGSSDDADRPAPTGDDGPPESTASAAEESTGTSSSQEVTTRRIQLRGR